MRGERTWCACLPLSGLTGARGQQVAGLLEHCDVASVGYSSMAGIL
jgi:hypothetical protein